MAKSSSAFAQSIPHPHHVFFASFEAGKSAARDWFRDCPTTLAAFRDCARMAHCWDVIDASEPGAVPLAASLDGFNHGFERGISEIIAGGARHA